MMHIFKTPFPKNISGGLLLFFHAIKLCKKLLLNQKKKENLIKEIGKTVKLSSKFVKSAKEFMWLIV